MTSEEYWDGDPKLTQYFLQYHLEKEREDFKQRNYELWLQGFYNYNASRSAIIDALSAEKKKESSYMEKPVNFFETEQEKIERLRQERLAKFNRMYD